jgi:isopenicillin N synthase-like dioxygenase
MDSGFLTLVLQDAEEGLEIEAQDGNWIKVRPLLALWRRHPALSGWR